MKKKETPGQLYFCEKQSILLYSTKEDAKLSGKSAFSGSPSTIVEYLLEEYGLKVSFIESNKAILVTKKEEDFWNVVAEEKIGWIVVKEWTEIKPLIKIEQIL